MSAHLDMGGRCGVCFQYAVQSPCPSCVRSNAGARRHEGWDTRTPVVTGKRTKMPPPNTAKEGTSE